MLRHSRPRRERATSVWRRSPTGNRPNSSINRRELPPLSAIETIAVSEQGNCFSRDRRANGPVPPPMVTTRMSRTYGIIPNASDVLTFRSVSMAPLLWSRAFSLWPRTKDRGVGVERGQTSRRIRAAVDASGDPRVRVDGTQACCELRSGRRVGQVFADATLVSVSSPDASEDEHLSGYTGPARLDPSHLMLHRFL